MNWKYLIPLVAVLMAGSIVLISDSDGSEGATGTYTDGNVTFNVVDSNAIIVSYTAGSVYDPIVIPSTVSDGTNTYPVTVIGNGMNKIGIVSGYAHTLTIPSGITTISAYAFKQSFGGVDCGALVIPDTVTSIGRYAFDGCNGFTSLDLSDGDTSIEDDAFNGCSRLTTVTIGENISSVGSSVFSGCTGLTSFNWDSSVAIPTGTFKGCTRLTNLDLSNVNTIGTQAFQNCTSLTSVTIPNNVTSIGGSAFNGCTGATTLIVEGSPTTIGTDAFLMSNLEKVINLGSNNTIVAGAYGIPSTATVLTYYFEYTVSGTDATITNVLGNVTTSLDIPATIDGYNVTVIGNNTNAIIQNSQLSSGATLTIPNGVTSIGSSAFRDCSGFTGSLTIPSSVTSIDSSAFQGCSGFTGSLTIPNGVTIIGSSAFQGCSGFTGSLTIPNGVTSIGSSAFQGCSGFNGTLTLPSGLIRIDNSAFQDCREIDSLINLSSATFGSNSLNMTGVTEVLNLGGTELNPGSYGLPSTCTVKTEIDADSYIAPASIQESHDKEGAVYTILALLPLFIILGALVMCATTIVRKN